MPRTKPSNLYLILTLGSLATISPFAIDLYLPAFQQMAEEFGTTPARVALSLSSFFVGLSLGQLFYGPLLDRFGRKRPLFFGLGIFILASFGCLQSKSVEALIAFRFLQALGGCVASVSATAMVRDFFPPREGAKIFSLLMLVLSVSPLLAPTIGGFVTAYLGWHWVFILLAAIVSLILANVVLFLPEGHEPDVSVSLRFVPILKSYWSILREPQFFTYAGAGALSFSGLFAYVAGAPIIFMDIFKVSPQVFGGIFAGLSVGLIGASQINIFLMKHFRSEQIFMAGLIAQTVVGGIFLVGSFVDAYGLVSTVVLLFLFLSSLGFSYPNASALALAPFSRNAGSASALLGFLQIGAGALASGVIGMFVTGNSLPIVVVISATALCGLLAYLFGRTRIVSQI